MDSSTDSAVEACFLAEALDFNLVFNFGLVEFPGFVGEGIRWQGAQSPVARWADALVCTMQYRMSSHYGRGNDIQLVGSSGNLKFKTVVT